MAGHFETLITDDLRPGLAIVEMPQGVIHAFKSLIRHGRHHVHVAHNDNLDPEPVNSRGLRHINHNAQPPAPAPDLNPPTKHIAEQIVNDERTHSATMPTYKGLEDYHLDLKMGDGAFSNVYKGVQISTGKKVAIKVVRKFELNASQAGDKHLNPQFKKKPRVTERANILKEVQIIRGTSHPSIVKLYSFSESPEHYFLVMELMEGGELFHQIVKLTYFSENLSRHVILQVARGIRYLHEERGVVHRDIKPENLLFEPIPIVPSKNPIHRPYDEEKEDEGEFIPGVGGGGIGRVKIADFGLSKVVWNEQTMTPCGTVGYTAPEIVKDERYSKSVDMWALGCVLYTLLCGFPPFYDESINVLTEKVARGYYTFLSPWWDDIGDSAKDLITHLLCVDPAQRYTIDEFLAHPWCNASPAPPPPPTPYTYQSKDPFQNQPLDSPLLSAARGGRVHEGRSPGIATLKEAFDITYAVHRMEEEGARRRKYQYNGRAGEGYDRHGFLDNLNEDEEEEEESEDDGHHSPQHVSDQQAHAAHGSVMDGRAGQRDQGGRGRIVTAVGVGSAQAQGQGPGKSKAPDRVAGGRSKVNNTNNHRVFELDLDGATLLERRGKRAAGAGAAVSVSSPLKMEGLYVSDPPTGENSTTTTNAPKNEPPKESSTVPR